MGGAALSFDSANGPCRILLWGSLGNGAVELFNPSLDIKPRRTLEDQLKADLKIASLNNQMTCPC